MIPLVKQSAETLAELLGKKAASDESFDVYRYFMCAIVHPDLSYLCIVIICEYTIRFFGNYTMETIFSVYLGYKRDLQRGETDEYFEAAFGTFTSPMRRGNILLGLVMYSKCMR